MFIKIKKRRIKIILSCPFFLLLLSEMGYLVVDVWIGLLFFPCVYVCIIFLHVEKNFNDDGHKDQSHPENLLNIDGVSKMNDIDNNSHTFSGCYDEGHDMLLE